MPKSLKDQLDTLEARLDKALVGFADEVDDEDVTYETIEVQSINLQPIQTGVQIDLHYKDELGQYGSDTWAFDDWDIALDWLADFVGDLDE